MRTNESRRKRIAPGRAPWIVALLLAVAAAPGWAQVLENVSFGEPEPAEAALPDVNRLRFEPPRAEQPPSIDGRLDEPLWAEPAAHLGSFRLGLSVTPARHTREAWAAWDETDLYLGVRLQREPGTELRVLTLEADNAEIWEDDEIEIFLDPFRTGSEYYHLIVNSAGVVYDASQRLEEAPDPRAAAPGEMMAVRRMDVSWDSGVRRAVVIEDERWTIEMALPLASIGLAGAPAGHQLGFNLTSADWDTEEYTTLSPVSDWHDPRQLATLMLGRPRIAAEELDLSGVGVGRNVLRLRARHLTGPAGEFRLTLTLAAPGQWLSKQTEFALTEGGTREVGLVFDVTASEGSWQAEVAIADADGRAVLATRRSGVLPGALSVSLGSRATLSDGAPVRVSARLGMGRLTARALTLRARLRDDAGTFAAEQDLGAAGGPLLSAVMPVAGLAPGLYRLEIAALDGERVVAEASDLLRVAASPFAEAAQ